MNHNSRRELLDRIQDLTYEAMQVEEAVGLTLHQIQEEWETHSDSAKTYLNLHCLANILIPQTIKARAVEESLKVAYGFLEAADHE